MIAIAAQRALFRAAVAGDLDAVRAFFAHPSNIDVVARLNAEHRSMREQALAHLTSTNQFRFHAAPHQANDWHTFYPREKDPLRGSLFQRTIEFKQLHVLEWFLSAEACKIIGDTMCTLANTLVLFAICSEVEGCDSAELVELILESDLCKNVLSIFELKALLQDLLRLAVRWDRADLLRLAVVHGADVNARVGNNTALRHCALLGRVACVDELVKCGVFGVQYELWSSITSVDTVSALINMGVDTRSSSGCGSPLHTAVSHSNLKMVETLVTRGFADVNARGKDGMTPLLGGVIADASRSKSCIPVASFLIANGADLRLRDKLGRTVLHYVTRTRVESELFEFLLTQDPELINIPDDKGRTPLHHWVIGHSYHYKAEDLDVLLSNGADPYIQDYQCESAFDELMKHEGGRAYVASRSDYFPSLMKMTQSK